MIRAANKIDFPRILEMSREFWKHTQFSEPFDEERTIYHINLASSHGLLIVLDVEGVAQGFVAAIKDFLLASKDAISAVELAYWVCPEFRKGSAGLKMIDELESAAKDQGVKYLSMFTMKTSNPHVAERIYLSKGYEPQESTFTKVLV